MAEKQNKNVESALALYSENKIKKEQLLLNVKVDNE